MIVTRQFIRFAIVGLVSNLLLYMLYLIATAAGVGHKTSMTALYLLGVIQTFFFNRNWTFSHLGTVPPAMLRYFLVYLAGYVVNWFVLYTLVDLGGWPHQWVQGVMILLLACAIFLSQKLWVFNTETVP